MANYPLHKINREGTILRSQHSYYSNEYAERMCTLHLRDEIHQDAYGKLHKYYRLHAMHPHNIEMALAYDIHCPDCHGGILKQIGRLVNFHELGLYRCSVCDKK